MIAEQAHEAPFRRPQVVNLASGRFVREGAVPEQREQGSVRAVAQSVGALAAHACKSGRLGDAAGARKRIEKAKLAFRRPAVPAAFRIASLAHRPAWITNAAL
jgi:hypothetical protein